MTGPSRPFRALRGGAVVLAVAAAWRVPTIEHAFAAALTAAADPTPGTAAAATRAGPDVIADSIAVAPAAAGCAGNQRCIEGTAREPAQASTTQEASVPPSNRRGPAAANPALAAETTAANTPPAGSASAAFAAAIAARPQTAGEFATLAYARLAAGDRRGAVALFDAALQTDDPRAAAWRRQRDALTRRWSASAYSIVRADGGGELAATPVLGGGQSGAQVAFTPDPLARRPLALTLRGSIAHDDRARSASAAVGLAWRPFAGVALAGERLVAIGPAARDEWTARLAAGGDVRRGRLHLTGYGEAGIIGSDPYAAVQARAAAVLQVRSIAVEPGIGTWSSLQHDRHDVDRVDVGPGLVARAGPLALAVDYRFRVAGNAAPGSGPVLTLSAGF